MDINEEDVLKFKEDIDLIENEISKVIVGQKDIVRFIIFAIISGGNVLLEGLPGLGKTELIKTVGKVLNLNFTRIQFTPDLMPADVTGTNIIVRDELGNSSFKFQNGPIFSNIVLADEINRATPKTQSAMLEAMQEKTVTVSGQTYILPSPFFVLATQNPIELDGTYPLPEAQMDRFMFKLDVKFPTKEELIDIVMKTTSSGIEAIDSVVDGDKILFMREVAKNVPIAKPVADFAMEVIMKTHPDYESSPADVKKYVRYGSSPRGAQAIITAAKVNALMQGRFNVSFDDIKFVALNVLRHRVFLNFEAIADGISTDDIINIILRN